MATSNGFFHRAVFAFRFKLCKSLVSIIRTAGYRAIGMRVGKRTRLPLLFVTWPHQVAIGECCRLEHHIYFHYDGIYKPGPSIRIGDHVFVGEGVEFNVRRSVSIGDNSLIAAGCRFIDHDHNISGQGAFLSIDGEEKEIILQPNVWLGANVVVLKGVTIAEGAVVAAGAVVTKSIPPNEIWAGVPAHKIGVRQSIK